MKKFIEKFKEKHCDIYEVLIVSTFFIFGTIALTILCGAILPDSGKKLSIEQDYAIQDIKDDLKREAFKDCIRYSQFSTCYKEFAK